MMPSQRFWRMSIVAAAACLATAALAACAADAPTRTVVAPAEAARIQDTRTFTVDRQQLAFAALPDIDTRRWTGILGSAGYRIEVPSHWNGKLVMYAHGYRGEQTALTVDSPPIRGWLVAHGYAWAASTYSANNYDVRAGIEDTNTLAQHFGAITGKRRPKAIYIVGESMGGHIAAAAVDAENIATENHKVAYAAAMPACGVVGGGKTEFDYLLNFTLAAQQIAGRPATKFPDPAYSVGLINSALWQRWPDFSHPGVPTAKGQQLEAMVTEFSGGPRPGVDTGFRGGFFNAVMQAGSDDGTVAGILARPLPSNVGVVYQFDADPAESTAETQFNQHMLRVEGDPAANPPQPDGMRWIPRVNGEFSVPVLTLHGTGDIFVPFSNEQVYARRAAAQGSSGHLVQRAIRSARHCDFTHQELSDGFAALMAWSNGGPKPAGDDVLDGKALAEPDYGCRFTTRTRAGFAACPATP